MFQHPGHLGWAHRSGCTARGLVAATGTVNFTVADVAGLFWRYVHPSFQQLVCVADGTAQKCHLGQHDWGRCRRHCCGVPVACGCGSRGVAERSPVCGTYARSPGKVWCGAPLRRGNSALLCLFEAAAAAQLRLHTFPFVPGGCARGACGHGSQQFVAVKDLSPSLVVPTRGHFKRKATEFISCELLFEVCRCWRARATTEFIGTDRHQLLRCIHGHSWVGSCQHIPLATDGFATC
mmetsp:Transcript_64960/g.128323  ORF Transcript_64960/g.128323 Transcript_64960/m.128323 type:complete len:236 (-) Transcript_64960:385-1092(-)